MRRTDQRLVMRRIPWFGVLIVVFLAACVCTYLHVDSAEGQPAEDDPGWDCATMGNGVCGDPTEPVPFDDGDAYPLDGPPEAQPATPISGSPSFTG